MARPESGHAREPPGAGDKALNALVTGATGFIGRHLVRHLLAYGDRVRILARATARAEPLRAAGAEVFAADLRDPGSLDGLFEGIEAVHHLASAVAGRWSDFEAVDVRGTERLLQEASRVGVRRFVYASSLAVYAAPAAPDRGRPDVPLGEDAPLEAPERAGHYGRAKIEAEGLVRAAGSVADLETVIVRPGLVHGPGRDPWMGDAPHLGVRRGRWFIVLGNGGFRLPLVYVADVAEGMRLCGLVEAAAGGTFNLVDESAPTRREYLAVLSRATGIRHRLLALPRWAAYPAGGLAMARARLAGRPATTSPGRLLAKARSPAFSAERARRTLGWAPRVPLDEGLEEAVRWWRSEAT